MVVTLVIMQLPMGQWMAPLLSHQPILRKWDSGTDILKYRRRIKYKLRKEPHAHPNQGFLRVIRENIAMFQTWYINPRIYLPQPQLQPLNWGMGL